MDDVTEFFFWSWPNFSRSSIQSPTNPKSVAYKIPPLAVGTDHSVKSGKWQIRGLRAIWWRAGKKWSWTKRTRIWREKKIIMSWKFCIGAKVPESAHSAPPYRSVHTCKILFRGLYSPESDPPQDYAVLVLLLNPVGFLISARPKWWGGIFLYHLGISPQGASRGDQPLMYTRLFCGDEVLFYGSIFM